MLVVPARFLTQSVRLVAFLLLLLSIASIAIAGANRVSARQLPVEPFSSAAIQDDPAQPGATGQITGLVEAGDTNLPLNLAMVLAYDAAGAFVNSDTTGADGLYTISDLDTGRYKLLFLKTGSDYAPEWYDDQDTQADAQTIIVTDGVTTPDIDAVLDIGGKISGTITAADTGLPLEDVGVIAYNSLDEKAATAEVSAAGTYTLKSLRSGDYRVQFITFGDAVDYVDSFYDDKPNLKAADPIAVTAPDEVTGIDAALLKGGQISGIVTANDSGLPLEDVFVTLYDSLDNPVGMQVTEADGAYAHKGLPPGEYRIGFDPAGVSTLYNIDHGQCLG